MVCVHCSPWFLGQSEGCVGIGCFGLEVFVKVSFLCIINVFHRENYVTEIAPTSGSYEENVFQFCTNSALTTIQLNLYIHPHFAMHTVQLNAFIIMDSIEF